MSNVVVRPRNSFMRHPDWLLRVYALLLFLPSPAWATWVTVSVINVKGNAGEVRVAFCRESEWDSHQCLYGSCAKAKTGTVDVRVDVPPGQYGVLVHHDRNANGRVDTNAFGMPTEGVGFSRNAHALFGFPRFSAVSLAVAGDTMMTTVSLVFEPAEVLK